MVTRLYRLRVQKNDDGVPSNAFLSIHNLERFHGRLSLTMGVNHSISKGA